MATAKKSAAKATSKKAVKRAAKKAIAKVANAFAAKGGSVARKASPSTVVTKTTVGAKRMGRPTRTGATADRKLFVRLTEAEYSAIERAARKQEKAVSVYVRDVVMASVESV